MGWHCEQTSTWSDGRVDRVSKVVPQLLQLTVVAVSSGWIPVLIVFLSVLGGDRQLVLFLGRECAEVIGEPGQRLGLELADPLAGQAELCADCLQ